MWNKSVEVCIHKGYLSKDVARRLNVYEVLCNGMSRNSDWEAQASADRMALDTQTASTATP